MQAVEPLGKFETGDSLPGKLSKSEHLFGKYMRSDRKWRTLSAYRSAAFAFGEGIHNTKWLRKHARNHMLLYPNRYACTRFLWCVSFEHSVDDLLEAARA